MFNPDESLLLMGDQNASERIGNSKATLPS
jgi:hypothetical protein